MTKILSIDGGGIRGIIPGTILKYLEQKIQEETNNPKARIVEYFDLVAGTSTGGILALALLCPGKNKHPKYSAKDAVGFYTKRGKEIFSVSTWDKIKTLGGLIDERFPADSLEQVFQDYFKDLNLSDLIKPCLITSYDIENRQELFFNQLDAHNKQRNFKVIDIARATSAAPTYFEAAQVGNIDGIKRPMIDGGVFANNPAMCALVESTKLTPKPQLDEIFVLSLGTGHDVKNEEKLTFNKIKDWGMGSWVKPLIDILMTANSQTVHYQLKKLFENTGHKKRYFRMQPELIESDVDMGNASRKNTKALIADAESYIKKNKAMLDAAVKQLLNN